MTTGAQSLCGHCLWPPTGGLQPCLHLAFCWVLPLRARQRASIPITVFTLSLKQTPSRARWVLCSVVLRPHSETAGRGPMGQVVGSLSCISVAFASRGCCIRCSPGVLGEVARARETRNRPFHSPVCGQGQPQSSEFMTFLLSALGLIISWRLRSLFPKLAGKAGELYNPKNQFQTDEPNQAGWRVTLKLSVKLGDDPPVPCSVWGASTSSPKWGPGRWCGLADASRPQRPVPGPGQVPGERGWASGPTGVRGTSRHWDFMYL